MSVAAPPDLVEAFAASGGRNVIPVGPTTEGAASYDEGFPPITRTPRIAGGIPPDGLDMNGILYAISAHTAWQAAGRLYAYNAAVSAAQSGYGVGAILQSASVAGRFFLNALAGNTNNPDSVTTGWAQFSLAGVATLVQSSTIAAGTTNDLALTAGVGILDVTANVAGSTLTGMAAGYDGQEVTVSNLHASGLLTLAAMTGSSATNRYRLAGDLTLLFRQSQTFKYSASLAVWVPK